MTQSSATRRPRQHNNKQNAILTLGFNPVLVEEEDEEEDEEEEDGGGENKQTPGSCVAAPGYRYRADCALFLSE